MKELLSLLRRRSLVIGFVIGLSLTFMVSETNAQRSLFEDGGYCPATQHSCDFTGGTIPYFPPDPFDVGYGCDNTFLDYTNDPQVDQDGNGIHDESCYGRCDLGCNTAGGTCNLECYANCQVGVTGTGGYAGCLRGAFGLGARPQPINVGPLNTPRFAGNLFRSCLAGNVPSTLADQYNSCIASGLSQAACCAEIANNFP